MPSGKFPFTSRDTRVRNIEEDYGKKDYIQDLISQVSADGVPKLVSYPYNVKVANDNTSSVEIPSDIFEISTDTVLVYRNGVPIAPIKEYTISQTAGQRGFINLVVRETNPLLNKDDEIFMLVLKNVTAGEEGYINGRSLAAGSVPQNRVINDTGWITDILSNLPGIQEAITNLGINKAEKNEVVPKSGGTFDSMITLQRADNSFVLELKRTGTNATTVYVAVEASGGQSSIRFLNNNQNVMFDYNYSDGSMGIYKNGDATRYEMFNSMNYGNIVTKATSFTPSLAERNSVYTVTAAATITIPANATVAFPIGTALTFIRTGTGAVTLAPASGVTLNSKDTKRAIDGQHASATVVKIAENIWQMFGALA